MNLKIPTSITVSMGSGFLKDFEEEFDALLKFLKPLGFRGIELSILKPERIPVRTMNEILDSYQMEIASISTGVAHVRAGCSLGDPDPAIRARTIEKLGLYAGFATEARGSPEIVIGLIRGRRKDGQSPASERENLIESLSTIDSILRDLGIWAVLEPINQYEIDSIHRVDDALALIKDARVDNTFPMIDTFHANMEEDPDTFFAQLPALASVVRKIDLASCNRRAPGPGCFNFKKFIKILVENGYWRYFNVECIPRPSFEEMAEDAATYLSRVT